MQKIRLQKLCFKYTLGGDTEIGSNLSNYSKFANKYYFPVILENYHVQGAIFIVLLHEALVTKV
jgi:hypothetical protein